MWMSNRHIERLMTMSILHLLLLVQVSSSQSMVSNCSKFLLKTSTLLFLRTHPADQTSRTICLSSTIVSQLHMEAHSHEMEGKIDPSSSSGFSPETHQQQQHRPFTETIMPHILNLYASRATARDFEIYSANASFEDPLMHAQGLKQIKSAFYSLQKVFSESEITEYSVKENAISPGKYEILIDNKQQYKFLGRPIDMISLIKLYVEDEKVVRHEDWWDKKPLKNRDTEKVPIVGRVLETIRRGSMLATHAMMGFGKDPRSGNTEKNT